MDDTNINYVSIIRASAVAAIIVGISAFLSQKSYSYFLLAGLLITIPIALPSLWFIEHKNSEGMKNYVKGFATGITLYCIAALCFYYMIAKLGYDKKNAIIIAMILWAIMIWIFYMFFRK